MGAGSFSREAYATYATKSAGIDRDTRFAQSGIRALHANLDPKNIQFRESCDSEDSPNATPIIFGLDVTGSMGFVAEKIAAEKLGDLITSIMSTNVVSNPHIMFMGIGDAHYDSYPIQLSQFEADNRIVEQLTQMYLEGGGGGNGFESYDLAWYMAAHHTKTDAYIKRKQKGVLFTLGDEMPPEGLPRRQIEAALGHVDKTYDQHGSQIDSRAVYENALETYDVFHVITAQGSYCQSRGRGKMVYDAWFKFTGKRTLWLDDVNNLTEVITAALRVNAGEDPNEVIEDYKGSVRTSVDKALFGPNFQ